MGVGKAGRVCIDKYIEDFEVKAIIDNNLNFRNQYYKNIPIVGFTEYLSKYSKNKIIIIASGKALTSIKNELISEGFVEYLDFIKQDDFLRLWYGNINNKLYLGRMIIATTFKCTLNCKHCGELMPYFKHPEDVSLEILKEDADILFRYVDYIFAVNIVGGEPFLYRNLGEYLEYIYENYADRIGCLQIITNGTIVPDVEMLKLIKKYELIVRISDYSGTVNYQNKLKHLIEVLHEYEIETIVYKQEEWVGLGLPEDDVCISDDPTVLRTHMITCNSMCQTIFNGKYYYCQRACSAEESGCYQLDPDDCLDLKKYAGMEAKKMLTEYHWGNWEKGYMSYCKVCRGYKTTRVVPAGVQCRRKTNNY